LRCLV